MSIARQETCRTALWSWLPLSVDRCAAHLTSDRRSVPPAAICLQTTTHVVHIQSDAPHLRLGDRGHGGRVTASAHPGIRTIAGHRLWIPRQHGAWAMLLLPVLLGVAASSPDPWQIVVAVTALAAYLASVTAQTWSRSRRSPAYRLPMAVYGTVAVVLGILLLVAFPPLALAAVVVAPMALLVFRGARPGTRRDLVNSLAQVAQALVLVPVTAWVSGVWDIEPVIAYTCVAAGYQLGSVLVVRSVLRERGNRGFAALAVGFHIMLVVLAALLLPLPYALVAAGLATRAAALPVAQRRLAGGPTPLRPIHVGIVEILASVSVVVVSFAAPI
jgi:hypothetical protein